MFLLGFDFFLKSQFVCGLAFLLVINTLSANLCLGRELITRFFKFFAGSLEFSFSLFEFITQLIRLGGIYVVGELQLALFVRFSVGCFGRLSFCRCCLLRLMAVFFCPGVSGNKRRSLSQPTFGGCRNGCRRFFYIRFFRLLSNRYGSIGNDNNFRLLRFSQRFVGLIMAKISLRLYLFRFSPFRLAGFGVLALAFWCFPAVLQGAVLIMSIKDIARYFVNFTFKIVCFGWYQ